MKKIRPFNNKNQAIWLYVDLPLLPINAVITNMQTPPEEKPIAIVSLEKNARRIVCCNQLAKHWGVEKSLSLSTALAICPELIVFSRDQQQEKQLLQQLALIAYRFSPEVLLDNQSLWLELSGCEQLFYGYQNLLKKLHQQFLSLKITANTGVGETPLAAKLLCGDIFHQNLPDYSHIQNDLISTTLEKLPSTKKQQQHFKQLGWSTVGDLLNLSHFAISKRFTSELIDTLQLLKGQKPYTLERFKPTTEFYDDIQNPQGIYSKESLLFPMKTLLQRFCHYLMARQCLCNLLTWRFEPLIGEHQSMTIKLSDSQHSWSSLLQLSRLQLERIELPQSIEKISLFCDQFSEMPGDNFDLFGNQLKKSENTSTLIDKLNARLGIKALSRVTTEAEHFPELASTISSVTKKVSSQHQFSVTQQPLWLLSKPAPIKYYNQTLHWQKPLTIISGPERLCSNWWQSEQQRDYYLASDNQGARYWIYRESTNRQWFLHGFFA
jgi:protein ImuB